MPGNVYNGSWRQLRNIWVYNGGWKQVQNAWVYNNGWRKFYQRSDPQTVTYNADWTWSYKGNGGQVDYTIDPAFVDGDVNPGNWAGGDLTDVTGLMGFRDTTAAARATRPVAKAVVLRIYPFVMNGSSATVYVTNFTDGGSKPGSFSRPSGGQSFTIGNGSYQELTLNQSMVDDFNGKWGMAIRLANGVTSGRFLGYGTRLSRVQARITLDYE